MTQAKLDLISDREFAHTRMTNAFCEVYHASQTFEKNSETKFKLDKIMYQLNELACELHPEENEQENTK